MVPFGLVLVLKQLLGQKTLATEDPGSRESQVSTPCPGLLFLGCGYIQVNERYIAKGFGKEEEQER